MNGGKLPACQVVLTTPELVELLSFYLSPADMSLCIQVNRSWSQVFIPILWHTIDDRKLFVFDQSVSRIEREKLMNDIRMKFKKYGHHIRVLRAESDIVIEAASVSCSHLKSLHLRPCMTCKVNEPETWAAYPEATEAAEVTRTIVATANAEEEARKTVGIEAYFAARIAAAETPEDVERLSTLFSDKEGRARAMVSFHHSRPLKRFLSSFTFKAPEDNATPTVREIKQLPGDLGVLSVGHPRNIDRLELDWLVLQDCWRLVTANCRLERLRMERMPAFREREASREFVHSALATLKELRELFLPPTLMDFVDFWSMDQFAPRVESLGLRTNCFRSVSDNDLHQPGTVLSSEKTFRGLKILSLNFPSPLEEVMDVHSNGQIELAKIPVFLRRLPNLETLSFQGDVSGHLANTTDPSDFQQQQQPVFGLKRLHFQGVSRQLSSLLPYLPDLIELLTEGMTTEISAALITHCKKLEIVSQIQDPWYIDDVDVGRPPSDGINDLFAHLPALKSVNMIRSCIHVEELAQRPWSCLGLEKLRCRIVGLERLSESQEEIYNRISAPDYNADLTEEELAVLDQFHRCRRQQGLVYDRLASLTKLKVLDIGYECRYPWRYKGSGQFYEVDGQEYLTYGGPIPDTMEFSMDSGLDRLSALKDLEMFGFEGNHHRIGERELDWMAEKWPRLNLMYGLAEDKLCMIEYDQKKAALRKYMQQLKPEVVHDSLFEDCMY